VTDPLLQVNQLRVDYVRGVPSLASLSLTVGAGECVAVVGANGAGKTTALNAIAGFTRATAGTVRLGSADITRTSALRRFRAGMGYVPEGRELFGSFSVAENLRLGGMSLPSAEREKARATADELFGVLVEKAGLPARSLSGGQQVMLAVARAVAGRPKVLLLDEPTLGLAPTAVTALAEGLRKLLGAGVGLLLAEQNLGLVEALATRMLALRLGEVVADGSVTDVTHEQDLGVLFLGA
jgi:ABC-type branched-subunit amino acid transport system ATPase component